MKRQHLFVLGFMLVTLALAGAPGQSPPQSVRAAAPNQSVTPKGVVLDFENAVVYIVDAATSAVTGPFLSGVASGFLADNLR
jgi:hypothetical protein